MSNERERELGAELVARPDTAAEAPDAPASDEERRGAARLAALLDGDAAALVATGEQDAALADVAEAALMIRASHQHTPLEAARREAMLDELLGDASNSATNDVSRAAVAEVDGAPSARTVARSAQPEATDLDAARARRASRMRRVAPLLALAASLLLIVGVVLTMQRDNEAPRHVATTSLRHGSFHVRVLSRPSDDLLGRPIDRDKRAAASSRLDRVFADRLAGYRQLQLARREP